MKLTKTFLPLISFIKMSQIRLSNLPGILEALVIANQVKKAWKTPTNVDQVLAIHEFGDLKNRMEIIIRKLLFMYSKSCFASRKMIPYTIIFQILAKFFAIFPCLLNEVMHFFLPNLRRHMKGSQSMFLFVS